MSLTDLPRLAAAFASAPGDMLAAILDQSTDCIKVIGPDGTVDYMNRNGQCAMEIDDFCMVAGQNWSALWPGESRVTIEQAIERARSGQPARFEAFCPTAKGSPRWWDVSVSPLRGPDGIVEGFIATSRDISERVRLGTLKEAVADEMRHRLRNHHLVVNSLLAAHARGRPDQESFVREMTGLLNALGVAQTMKAEPGETHDLSVLVPALLAPFATPDCPIEISALPEAALDQGLVDAFALVLGELAVNSTKHGALSAAGRVTLSGDVAQDTLILTWSERSGRTVSGREREGGQGLRLMTRVLAARGGSIAIDWADDGLDARIKVALPA